MFKYNIEDAQVISLRTTARAFHGYKNCGVITKLLSLNSLNTASQHVD